MYRVDASTMETKNGGELLLHNELTIYPKVYFLLSSIRVVILSDSITTF